MMNRPYRIILADDHILMREGIKRIIAEKKDMQVVAEASDGLELLNMMKTIVPDMVVLDVSMPKLRGIEAAQEIKKMYPQVSILFLSMYKKRAYLHLSLATGAKGYILKEDTSSELIRAIETIRRGGIYLSPLVLAELPNDYIETDRSDSPSDVDKLTTREREVLKLIAEGRTSKEIAGLLFISSHTVNNHRRNIKKKLNIHNNADLVKYALQQGYT
jgi:DNA-binding NarL/FixJ family response regulator